MNVLGLMSGTSLDGVDLLLVSLELKHKRVKYQTIKGKTVKYPLSLKKKLINAPNLNGIELSLLNNELGRFFAKEILQFKTDKQIDLIASHGHTIFHQPENKLTLQIGSCAEIASITGIKTIGDFRSTDVALGGQGAPLVPFGDELLFPEYDYCLNLGGYSNISFKYKNQRMAFDISPCNIVLNYLASKKGKSFDKNGNWARNGKLDSLLFKTLNKIPFYSKKGNKSLGNEWLEKEVMPLLKKSKLSIEDQLNTFCEHIAYQISKHVKGKGKILITGGGAYNSFLIERIKANTNNSIILPSNELIEFKEALIFAFLGFMREKELINTFASATGASRDSSGGAIYYP